MALSDAGNTRFPRSVLSFSPCDSKSSIVCVGDRRFSAEYRNLPSPGIFSINVLISQLFVILHLPLPVMRSLRPSSRFGSSSITRIPRSAAVAAHIMPAGPPPMTTSSASAVFLLCSIMFFSGKFIYLSNEAISSAVRLRHFPAGRSPSSTLPSRTRRSFVTLSPTAAHIFLT